MRSDRQEAETPPRGRRAGPRLAGLALAAALTALAGAGVPANAATAAVPVGAGAPGPATPGAPVADDGAYVTAEHWIDARTLDLTIDSPGDGHHRAGAAAAAAGLE